VVQLGIWGETSAWGVAGRSVNDLAWETIFFRKMEKQQLTPMIRETDLPMLLSVMKEKSPVAADHFWGTFQMRPEHR